MRVSDMRLLDVDIIRNSENIFSGRIDDAPEEIQKMVVKSAIHEGTKMIITVED